MGNVYLTVAGSEFLRPSLVGATPFSPNLHELFARAAAGKHGEQTIEDPLKLLTQKGYLGVEERDGIVYLGLPRYLSRSLMEALVVAAARPDHGMQTLVQSVSPTPEEDQTSIYIAIPEKR